MNLRWLPAADAELAQAIAWYDAQQDGLSERLLQELTHALSLIEQFPRAWHPLTKRIRQKRLNRFPYAVIYTGQVDRPVVLAFAHQHRQPNYWRGRLKQAQ